MTIIYAASDIHLEFGGPIEVPECDVLLLSGDILTAWRHPGDGNNHHDAVCKREKKFFQQCQDKVNKTYMILGNHEHYNGVFKDTADKVRSKIRNYPAIELLDNTVVEIGDIAIFGATFWTDMKQSSPDVMWTANRGMNDFIVIKKENSNGYYNPATPFRAHDSVIENDYSRKKLTEFLSAYQDKNTIVMTHHAPSFVCIDRKYSLDMLSYAFANTCLEDMLLDGDGPDVWLYGHCHHRKDFMFGNKTRIVANARGYFGTSEAPFVRDFTFKQLTFEKDV